MHIPVKTVLIVSYIKSSIHFGTCDDWVYNSSVSEALKSNPLLTMKKSNLTIACIYFFHRLTIISLVSDVII